MNNVVKKDWEKLDKLYASMNIHMVHWCMGMSESCNDDEDCLQDIADRYGIRYEVASKMLAVGERADKLFIEQGLMNNLPNGYNSLYSLVELSKKDIKSLCSDGVPTRKQIRQKRVDIGQLPPPAKKPAEIASSNTMDAVKESVINSLPKGTGKATINKVVSGLKKEEKRLIGEFITEVNKAADDRSKIQRENMRAAQQKAKDELGRTLKMASGVKAFLSKKEFSLIRSCLHPDKNNHPKASEAFQIFNKLAVVKDW